MASYVFSESGDFTESPVILSELQKNIESSSISSATVLYITQVGDVITIYFSGTLSGPDQTTLSNLCLNYVNLQRPIATSSTTGDFTVSGGMGIGANLWIGSEFSSTNTSTAGSILNIPNFVYTSTSTSPSNVNIASIGQVTIAETNASTTITNAASFYVAGAPTAGTNVSAITNPYSVYVAAGKTYLGGTLQIPTGATNGYILTSDANGNASWAVNSFSGGFADGTASLPGIFFSSQPSTGFYRPGSGQIGVELAGANYATFTTSGLNLVTGSTLNVGSSGTTSPLNVYGLITGFNGLTISSGDVNFQTATLATSSTVAAVNVSGGLGVAKNIWAGTTYTDAVLTSNNAKGLIFNTASVTITDNALAAGTTSNINTVALGQVTLATSANAITATNAATLYIAGAPAAGANMTITNPYALHVASGNSLLGGNLTVSGNFTVNGTLTTLNVTNVNTTDPMIGLAINNTADTFDLGFWGKYVNSGTKFAGLIRQANTNSFYLFSDYTTDLTTATAISGVEGFVSDLFINTLSASATASQIVLGTTNTITLNAPAPAVSRTYTIPDAGGAANFIMSTFGSAQTIAGGLISSGTLTASNGFTLTTGALSLTSTSGSISLTGTSFITDTSISITATTNQISLGSTNTVTLTSPAPAASRTYTIPDAGGAANFIMSTFGSAQTIAGGLISSGTLTASNGFTLTTGALNLTSTSGTISLTGTSFTTNTAMFITATTNQLRFGVTNTVTITSPAPAASRTYTIPDAGANASFIMSTSGTAQNIAGGLISAGTLTASNGFTLTTGALNLTSTSGTISLTGTSFTTNTAMFITATTNQLRFGVTNTVTITSPAPAASRTYTIPDAGGAANFIMSTFGSAQTIAGGLTSSGTLTASNGFTLTTGALNLTSTSGAISLTGTSFTTNNAVSITASTLATSSSTGCLVLSGGIGVAENMWIGTSYTDAVLTSNSTKGIVLNSPAVTITDNTLAAGTTSNINSVALGQITIATTTNSVTATNAATLYIANAPAAGTNITITNPYALYVNAGKTYIGGVLQIPTGATDGYILTSDANGNASWAVNSFSGGFADGTAALPGIFFDSQPGTGFYRPGSGQIGIELAGANYATFTTTGLNLVNGSTLNVGSSGTTSPLNIWGLISGFNGITISAGTSNFQTTTIATSSTAAAVNISGGLGVAKNIWVGTTYSDAVFTSNSTKGLIFNAAAVTITDNALAAGTTSNINTIALGQVTLATSANAVTATSAATLYVANAPAAGANVTITNPYAIHVAAGKTYVGGALQIPTGAAANQVLRSDAAGNASWADPVIYYSAFSTTALTTTSTSLIAMSGLSITLVATGTYQITFKGEFFNQQRAVRSLFDIYNSTAAATVANSSFAVAGSFYQNSTNYGTATLNIVVIVTISTPNTVIQGRFATSNASGSVTMVSNGSPTAGCNSTTSLIAVRIGA